MSFERNSILKNLVTLNCLIPCFDKDAAFILAGKIWQTRHLHHNQLSSQLGSRLLNIRVCSFMMLGRVRLSHLIPRFDKNARVYPLRENMANAVLALQSVFVNL